jgi:hypothetical protein
MALSVETALTSTQILLAQQTGGGAYAAGQIVGVLFLVVLAVAILWKIFKR